MNSLGNIPNLSAQLYHWLWQASPEEVKALAESWPGDDQMAIALRSSLKTLALEKDTRAA